MPCVCLANTFARRQSLKLQKQLLRKPVAEPVVFPPIAKLAAAGSHDFSDGTVVRVPHVRKSYVQLQNEQKVQTNLTQENLESGRKTTKLGKIAIAKTKKNTIKQPNAAPAIAPVPTSAPAGTTLAPKPAPSLYTPKKSRHTISQVRKSRQAARALSKTMRKKRATEQNLANDMPNVNFNRPSVHMTRADLINAESRLGSTIFGPIPAGHRREFFHDHDNVWIWHEDWRDGHDNPHQMTVRYEVRTSGVYKKVSAGKYLKLDGDELENFRKATHAYLNVIKKYLYNSQKLAQA